MTVIEFFDRAALKNIASALLCNPDRVIMIGHDVRMIRESFNYFCPLIESHGKTVEFIARHADRNNIQEIIEVLSQHYGVEMPIVVDNAESVTRLADVQAQVIRLVVSEGDDVLRVEINEKEK